MKRKPKLLLMLIAIVAMTTFASCGDDDDCPGETFNTLAECEDATDGKKCVCVQEGTGWKAILNP